MAKPLSFPPQSQIFKNPIPGIHKIRTWSRTQFYSPINLLNPPPYSKLYSKNVNSSFRNVLHVGRFSSVSITSVPSFLCSSNNICSSCHSIYLPYVTLHPLCRPCLSSIRILMSNSSSQGSTKTVRCVIKGRVQGVFYRNWTVENANQLGLKGWVRNRRDGSVEALFSGKDEVVDEMLQRCRRGPPHAMVTAFEANPCHEEPGAGFERKPTL